MATSDKPIVDVCTACNTAALRQARKNLSSNLSALDMKDEHLPALPQDLEFVYARDGFLSARASDGWISGCSLPHRAAQAMCAKLRPNGILLCLLAPNHAGQIRAVLEKLTHEQALLVIIPQASTLHLILHCDDFGTELRSGRLWLVWGDDWTGQMEQIFTVQSGLVTPTQFIRLTTCDEATAQPLIAGAREVFSRVNADRAQRIAALRASYSPTKAVNGPLLVAGPMRFALWDDAPACLVQALSQTDDLELHIQDTGLPTSCSTLALAEKAVGCSAMVCADLFRSDMPGVIPDPMPWITWVTTPRLAPPVVDAPRDRLLLADPAWIELARSVGWERSRLSTACWPVVDLPEASADSPHLALLSDVRGLEAPAELEDYSSHRVLWETLRHEIQQNPFCIRTDIQAFLNDWMHKVGIADDHFPRQRFIHELILPAYAISLARLLHHAGVPLRVYGRGWTQLEHLDVQACPIDTRAQLQQAVAHSTALVHPHPCGQAHPVHGFSRPVLGPAFSPRDFLIQAKQLLESGSKPAVDEHPLNGERIRRVLREAWGVHPARAD